MDKTGNIKIGNKFLHIVVNFNYLEMTLTNQEHKALKSYKQTELANACCYSIPNLLSLQFSV